MYPVLYFLTITLSAIYYQLNKGMIKAKYSAIPYYFCYILMFISTMMWPPFGNTIRFTAIVITGFCILRYLQRNDYKIIILGALIPLLIYIFVCMLSMVWSIEIFKTFIKAVELICDVFLLWIIFIKDENASKNIFDLSMIIATALLLTILVGIVMFPELYFVPKAKSVLGYQLKSPFLSPNSIGALSLLPIIWSLNSNQKIKNIIILAISVSTLILAQSRTSLISIVIILSIKFFVSKSNMKYKILCIIIVMVAFYNFDYLQVFYLRGSTEEQMTNISGRGIVWGVSKQLISQRPLLGYGFGVGGAYASTLAVGGGSAALNSIFDTILGVGSIGLVALLIPYIQTVYNFIKIIFKNGFRACTAEMMVFVWLTLRSITSTCIGGWHSFELLFWFYLVIKLAVKVQEISISPMKR